METTEQMIDRQVKDLKKQDKHLHGEVALLEHQLDRVYSSKAYSLWLTVTVLGRYLKDLTAKLFTGRLLRTLSGYWYLYRHQPKTLELKLSYFFKSIKSLKIKHLKQPVVLNPPKVVLASQKIDIVIPWYGDTNIFPLLTHLEKNWSRLINQIIVVNDCYPDQSVVAKLEKAANTSLVTLLSQKENKGFVSTANMGLAASKRDVVLMNSDVWPTGGWLEEMLLAAESNDRIASVTAVSNNATAFSIPEINVDNNDSNPEETARLIKRFATSIWYETPTAHGFCMWIRRAALEDCGAFDEATFGRGFGEENDLSQRFIAHNWLNVVAAKSYVLHYESMSFGDEVRKAQVVQNLPKVINRYPDYINDVWAFIHSYPTKTMSDLLKLHKKSPEFFSKPTTLNIIHSNPFTVIGGVEKEMLGMINFLEKKYKAYNHLIYFYHKEKLRYEVALIHDNKVQFIMHADEKTDPTVLLEWLLQLYEPKIAIVQHLLHHSLEYGKILKTANVPALLFVHDFYYFCQIPDLINQFGVFCNYEKNLAVCDSCLAAKLRNFNPQGIWRERCRSLLQYDFDGIVFNSEFTLETYKKLYKLPDNNRYHVSFPDLGVPE